MKKWYLSKTIWAQVVAVLAIVVQLKTGWIVDPALQGSLLVLINLVLRGLTNKPLTAKKVEKKEKDNG